MPAFRSTPAVLAVLVCAAVVALPRAASALQGGGAGNPTDGRAVLERMRAAYAGRWYESLAFVQRTTFVRADGTRDTATWFESLKGPDQLRIDFGALTNGRAGVFTAESSFVFREGKLFRTGAEGNPFLPLIQGVYLQPVEATVRGVAHHGFDLTKVHRAEWRGRPVYVVGAASPADSAVAQFWVDTERLLVVRMRAAGGGAAGAPLLDIHLDDYVKVGGGWLATTVAILSGGQPRQLEEYTAWSDRVLLPDALFDRRQLVTAGHWAAGERPSALWTLRP